jgi:hypothetical protein
MREKKILFSFPRRRSVSTKRSFVITYGYNSWTIHDILSRRFWLRFFKETGGKTKEEGRAAFRLDKATLDFFCCGFDGNSAFGWDNN